MPNSTADQLTGGADATMVAFAGAPFGGGASLSFSSYQITQGGLLSGAGRLPVNPNSGFAGYDLNLAAGDASGGNANGGSIYAQLGLNQGSGTAGSFNIVKTDGTTLVTIDNNGAIYGPSSLTKIGPSGTNDYIQFQSQNAYHYENNACVFITAGNSSTPGILVNPSYSIGWSSSAAGNSGDLTLYRDAADTLAQRRGTNAQAFRVYNTYTDASNYERHVTMWSSNICYVKNENAGTGSARLYIPVTGGTTVAGLPSAATAGMGARAFVTDANATTFLSTVVGGGANKVPVVSDGTNWLIG